MTSGAPAAAKETAQEILDELEAIRLAATQILLCAGDVDGASNWTTNAQLRARLRDAADSLHNQARRIYQAATSAMGR